ASRARIEAFRHGGRFADLRDDPVPLVLLDNSLHLKDNMLLAGSDNKVSRALSHPLVLLGRQLDRLGASLVGALTDPVRQCHPKSASLVDLADALIDLAEQGLVLA